MPPALRLGAVTYLNARPLTRFIFEELPEAAIVSDAPSRLAERLLAGELDVALIPSIEYARSAGLRVVSDACVACEGPVRSVKLYGRVPPEEIRSLALDAGSRTSAALGRLLLREQLGLEPRLVDLPLGADYEQVEADAVLVIGDRGLAEPNDRFAFAWDLGQRWAEWQGLPFVFAMWVTRPGVQWEALAERLAAARNRGVAGLADIAREEAPRLPIDQSACLEYLRENLTFTLGPRQRLGLERFYELAGKHGLAPRGVKLPPCPGAGRANVAGTRRVPSNVVGTRRVPSNVVGTRRVPSNVVGTRRVPSNVVGTRRVPSRKEKLSAPGNGTEASIESAPGARNDAVALSDLAARAAEGERLTPEAGLALLEWDYLPGLGRAADTMTRRLHPEPVRTYNIDRNINYTNVCTGQCRFCAFSCPPGHAEGYVIGREELYRKIDETIALGGNQILLQGGMNPALGLDWYESLLRDLKRWFPTVHIHGLSPPEIWHLVETSRLELETVLGRLREAGLGSLPGGGAEILVDRVRREISPCKCSAEQWLAVCRAWHRLGGRGTATMMFGHVETPADRIEHLGRLRALQDETGGFAAFIAWTFQPGCTGLAGLPKHRAHDYLKTLAVARLFLDNFPNVQASWVTQGLEVGQLALQFGANDFGSLMIEENVVAAAGTRFRTDENELRRRIAQLGFRPARRDVFYRLLDETP